MGERSYSLAAVATRIVVALVALVLFMGPAIQKLLHLEGTDDAAMSTPVYWIELVAPSFFLAALWSASGAFDRMHRGDGFGPALVCGLRDIGACLMLGAFAATVVQPSLIHLFANDFREMRGVQFHYDLENLTLALVGFVLMALARQGRELQSKLDEFV